MGTPTGEAGVKTVNDRDWLNALVLIGKYGWVVLPAALKTGTKPEFSSVVDEGVDVKVFNTEYGVCEDVDEARVWRFASAVVASEFELYAR